MPSQHTQGSRSHHGAGDMRKQQGHEIHPESGTWKERKCLNMTNTNTTISGKQFRKCDVKG